MNRIHAINYLWDCAKRNRKQWNTGCSDVPNSMSSAPSVVIHTHPKWGYIDMGWIVNHTFVATCLRYEFTTTSGWPYYHVQDIHGPFKYGSELVFLPPALCGLRGHPYNVLPRESHCRSRGLWNSGISSRLSSLQLLLTMFSRKYLRNGGLAQHPPASTLILPITSYHLCIFPKSQISIYIYIYIYIYMVSSGPLWLTFYHHIS